MDEHDLECFCPITHELLEDPVKAEDGQTYDRKGIDAWFASCRQRNLDITSPCTRQAMGCEVQRHEAAAENVTKYRGKFAGSDGGGHVTAGASETQTLNRCLDSESQSQALNTETQTQTLNKCLECETQTQTQASTACELRCAMQNIPSILKLCRVFTMLQPVRSILDKSLEGWQPPRILVIGTSFCLPAF
jgi:hypothetical protein